MQAAAPAIAVPAPPIDSDEDLQALYNWVDEVPLSRPKRNISRDFADGVLFAEIVNGYFPRIVEMHNYSAANSNSQKLYNWNTLNTKVLKKMGFQIHQQDLDDIIKAQPGAIERVLKLLKDKVELAQRGDLRVGQPSVASVMARLGPPSDPGPERNSARGSVGSRQLAGPGLPEHAGHPPGAQVHGPSRDAAVREYQREVDAELLVEKEQTIAELREMVAIMSEKTKKLEQLVRIKDSKIEALTQKLQKNGIA